MHHVEVMAYTGQGAQLKLRVWKELVGEAA